MPIAGVSGSSCLRMCISVNADSSGNRICSLLLGRISLIGWRHMGFQTAFLRNRRGGMCCLFCGNFGYGGGRCYNNGLFLQGNIMEATVYLEDNEYIALCDLLKLAGLAESGGQAKALIAEGLVSRNGETETRKTAKIRGGEVIEFDGARLEIADGYDPEA